MRRLVIRALVALCAIGAFQLVGVPVAWSAPETRFALVKGTGPHRVAFPLTHLGVRWQGSEEAQVQVRWQRPSGTWTPWRDLTVAHDLEDDATGTVYSGLVRVPQARDIETRVAAGEARNVEVVAIDTENGPRRLETAPALPAASASIAGAKVPPPGIVTRAEWGADESLRNGSPSFAPLKRLVVHHTDSANDDPNPAATVRAIYAYHTNARGWADIGYNFLVDAQGRVYEGRWARTYAPGEVHNAEDTSGRGVVGAHAEGANTGSVGVALLGNFSTTSPTNAAINGLQATLAWKADRHDIDPNGAQWFTRADGTSVNLPNISGHRDTKSTACPGDVLWNRLPEIRTNVARIIQQAHGTTPGYWVATRDGAVHALGAAGNYGSMAGQVLNSPIVGIAATRTGKGYWLLGRDGGIFSFGDAQFFGSTGGMPLNSPVIGIAATPSGAGYWLVAGDGGIFSFGDAQFYGSTGGMKLNAPVLGMAPTANGGGYWLFARDGGIFSYGNAAFYGSTGGMKLNSPVNGMDKEANGNGYWLVARDGGVFAFNVPFYGSVPGLGVSNYAGSVAMRSTATGTGYYVLAADGWIAAFGHARDHGWKPLPLGTPVDMALVPEST